MRGGLSVAGRITITYLVSTSLWIALAVLAISAIEYSAGCYAGHGFALPTGTPLRPMLAYVYTLKNEFSALVAANFFCKTFK